MSVNRTCAYETGSGSKTDEPTERSPYPKYLMNSFLDTCFRLFFMENVLGITVALAPENEVVHRQSKIKLQMPPRKKKV